MSTQGGYHDPADLGIAEPEDMFASEHYTAVRGNGRQMRSLPLWCYTSERFYAAEKERIQKALAKNMAAVAAKRKAEAAGLVYDYATGRASNPAEAGMNRKKQKQACAFPPRPARSLRCRAQPLSASAHVRAVAKTRASTSVVCPGMSARLSWPSGSAAAAARRESREHEHASTNLADRAARPVVSGAG